MGPLFVQSKFRQTGHEHPFQQIQWAKCRKVLTSDEKRLLALAIFDHSELDVQRKIDGKASTKSVKIRPAGSHFRLCFWSYFRQPQIVDKMVRKPLSFVVLWWLELASDFSPLKYFELVWVGPIKRVATNNDPTVGRFVWISFINNGQKGKLVQFGF